MPQTCPILIQILMNLLLKLYNAIMTVRWLLLISQFVFVYSYEHAKDVTLVEWQQKCRKGSLALNDCNWCRCNVLAKYSCTARVCSEVDPFGHFNDAIADINVGMEGRGSWRSKENTCEPGVEYRRSDLICICSEDGTWPNPVCRDIFRVLHLVEVTEEREPDGQKCDPTKLYLIGCNVCYCPSTGQINPDMCTKKTCTGQDDILDIKEDRNDDEDAAGEELAIYAACTTDKKYSLGCKTCVCLKNNRLYCSNCTNTPPQSKNSKSLCNNLVPGQVFSVDCNLCFCDKNGYAYCTVKKCLPQSRMFSRDPNFNKMTLDKLRVDEKLDVGMECVPGQTVMRDCNKCTCFTFDDGRTGYFCTLLRCSIPTTRSAQSFEYTLKTLSEDCVVNTAYELNCLICRCGIDDKGEKYESCEVNSRCQNDTVQDLDNLHGYCEPLHVYRKGCNVCKCLTDGKTVRCTSHACDSTYRNQEPITIDVVPVSQSGDPCPSGSSYKIDCNVCFCLNNGNAICTTIDCKKSHLT